MPTKVYNKKGNVNYVERRLKTKLQEYVDGKLRADPSYQIEFKLPENEAELKAVHDKYCITDVEYTDIPKGQETDHTLSNEKSVDMDNTQKTPPDAPGATEAPKKVIDPFNKSNPNIRDYVLGDDPANRRTTDQPAGPKKTHYDEPLTFDESFALPDTGGNPQMSDKPQTPGSKPVASTTSKPAVKQEPVNPAFDTMTTAKKNKQTRLFAKNIVRVVCSLSEKGYIYWLTKDINEGKLAEYEATQEIDLSLLLSLEEGQEYTVRSYFMKMNHAAIVDSKITDEQKKDLEECLYDVMLEKGIAPTPMQSLLMTAGEIFGLKALDCWQKSMEVGSVLTQLRAMQAEKVKESPIPNENENDTAEAEQAMREAEEELANQEEEPDMSTELVKS